MLEGEFSFDMAEPVSLLLGLLGLTERVVTYLNGVKDSSKDRLRVLVEISSINGLLFSLKDLASRAESDGTWPSALTSLSVPNGPLQQFKLALEELAVKLAPADSQKDSRVILSWPFKKGEVNALLCRIERQKSMFILALQNDHMYIRLIIILLDECSFL